MDDLTKLDFGNSFSGRIEELEILKDAYQKAKSTKHAQLLSIEGESGVGKSELVEAFYEQVLKHEKDCFFGRGKMEEGRSFMRPLSAFVDAVQDILDELDPNQWKEHIQSALGEERSVLETVMPLGSLLGEKDEVVDETKIEPAASTENEFGGFDRLNLSFRELFRALASRAIIVVCLDDMQWCAPSMLYILDSLLRDSTPRTLLLIEAHRPVDYDSNPALHSFLGKHPSRSMVRLGVLSEDDISVFLSRVLRREKEEVMALAAMVKSKTAGNAFFVRQLLSMLQDHPELLHFSVNSLRWEWDIGKIRSETHISDNVVDLVLGKLQGKNFTHALTMAALLGSTQISIATLHQIMDDNKLSMAELKIMLADAEKEGFLEETNSGFKFAHDRILEACVSLLPLGDELDQLHLRTGRLLLGVLRETPEFSYSGDELLFQTVSLLNEASELIDSQQEKRELAELNIAAAEAAKHRSSYFPAAAFLRAAIELLGCDPWNTNRSIMLTASIILCRMAYCCGEPEESITVADAILQNATNFHARNAAAHTKLLVLDQQRQRKEGFDLVRGILGELGIKIPRRFVKFHVIRKYMNVKRLTSGLKDSDILGMPEASDVLSAYRCEFLVRLGEMAISWGMEDYLAVSFLIAIEMTLKEGRIPMTSQALMVWGTILAQEKQYDQAYRYGQLGLQIAKERKGGSLDDRAVVLYYSWIQHWRKPFVEGVEPISEALKILWDGGSLEAVFMDTESYLGRFFVSGLKLKALESDIQKFYDLCCFFNQKSAFSSNLPFFQMVSNLVGVSSEHTVELTGSYMEAAGFVNDSKKTRKVAELNNYYLHGAMAAYFFNDYTTAWKLSSKITQIYHEGPEVFVPSRFYFKGLIGFALAKETGSWRAFRAGQSGLNEIQTFVKAGVTNCYHSLLVLCAERTSIVKASKPEMVRKAFDEAIQACARLGYLYDAAIASERAGLYHLSLPDETARATTYLSQAAAFYLDWEAHAKVKQLETAHASLFGLSSRVLSRRKSQSLKGKSRLGKLKTEETQTLGPIGLVGGSSREFRSFSEQFSHTFGESGTFSE